MPSGLTDPQPPRSDNAGRAGTVGRRWASRTMPGPCILSGSGAGSDGSIGISLMPAASLTIPPKRWRGLSMGAEVEAHCEKCNNPAEDGDCGPSSQACWLPGEEDLTRQRTTRRAGPVMAVQAA